jgi:hypothetical protein
MTQSTDSRQLRLLIEGILSAYGIDNFELSIKLTDGIKRMIGDPTPVRTREEILKGIERALTGGVSKQAELEAISDEILKRAIIRPVTKDWIEFVAWAWQQNKNKGQNITKFLDWWLSDDWQRDHPPTKPESWYVKWDRAFIERVDDDPYKNFRDYDKDPEPVTIGVPNPYRRIIT